ncbi:SRPBCC family protein [Pedobacter sp. L105]|uniref:SRPBCC family protein n=1 Tax=Pedobacter sp. L105 TaxID=1641871 RepID=UPI00131BCED0|nr:SRPBCC family protein [Pedobacter sp. L105]
MKIKILLLSLATVAIARQANAKSPQVTVTTIVHAPLNEVFDYIVPVSLPHIFKKYGSFPAIVNTSVKSEWKTPGMERVVTFNGGATGHEHLLTVVPHQSFSYMINDFSNSLRHLTKRIEGQWKFTDVGGGNTKIEWTYKIIPKNFITHSVIDMMVIGDARGYLTNALSIIKDDLDSGAYKNYK